MRRDPFNNPLPPKMHYKGLSYYLVVHGKWHRLGRDYDQKLAGHTSRAMTERYLQLLRTDRVKPVRIK